jgi:uroporphyrinogen-III synthase
MKTSLCALITRPQPQADELAALIRQAGGQAIVYPVFSIEDPVDFASLKTAIQLLAETTIAIFVSPRAVEKTVPYWPKLHKNILIAAVGKSTQKVLKNYGFSSIVCPESDFSSEALLELPELKAVQNKNIIVFQGETGRGLLQRMLIQRGAKVFTAIAYRRVLCQPINVPTLLDWKKKGLNCVIYTSVEGILNLFKLTNLEEHRWLKSISSVVISARLAKIAKETGILHVIESKNARANVIIEALKNASFL